MAMKLKYKQNGKIQIDTVEKINMLIASSNVQIMDDYSEHQIANEKKD